MSQSEELTEMQKALEGARVGFAIAVERAEAAEAELSILSDERSRRISAGADVNEPEMDELIGIYDMQPDAEEEGCFSVDTQPSSGSAPTAPPMGLAACYHLMACASVSRLRRARTDEIWHFYLGGPMTIVELDTSASTHSRSTTLGRDVLRGHRVQHIVRAGTWVGRYPNEEVAYSFVGCTAASAPQGSEPAPVELGSNSALRAEFPRAHGLIDLLTEGMP